MRSLRDAKFNLSFPLFAKDYKEYDGLRDLMKKADALHAALIKNIMTDAEYENFSADKIVSDLFAKAKAIPTDNELYLKAVRRVRLGNPPGKEDSTGDAVSWESLLRDVPKNEDIYIVSGDRDFRSQLVEGDVNEFLYEEWDETKNSHLHFYSKISDFFKANFPNIKIASEVERDLLIQKLAKSGSFASTHAYIGKLLSQSEFSPAQVEQLVEIPGANSQVGMIVGDDDVHQFYVCLLQKYGDKIQKPAAAKLAEIVAAGTPAKQSYNEVPF